MENEIFKVKHELKILQNKLQTEKLSIQEINRQIDKYKDMSMKMGEKIQNVIWKISKADFIRGYEKERSYSYLDKIKTSTIFISKSRITGSSKRRSEDYVELRKSLSNKLDLIVKRNIRKKQLIADLEQVVGKLKEENTALMHKLLADLEEKENKEKRLEDILDEIQSEDEIVSFQPD